MRRETVDVEWHAVRSGLINTQSQRFATVIIRLQGDDLARGLRQGDVIYQDNHAVLVVNIPIRDCMQIRVDPAVPAAMARMCYEVGNTHAMLLRGEDDYTFYISDVIVYHLLRGVLEQLDGVEINLVRRRLDLTDVMPVSMEL